MVLFVVWVSWSHLIPYKTMLKLTSVKYPILSPCHAFGVDGSIKERAELLLGTHTQSQQTDMVSNSEEHLQSVTIDSDSDSLKRHKTH